MYPIKEREKKAKEPCITVYKKGAFTVDKIAFQIIPYHKNPKITQALISKELLPRKSSKWISGLKGEYYKELKGDIFQNSKREDFRIKWISPNELDVTELREALSKQGLLEKGVSNV